MDKASKIILAVIGYFFILPVLGWLLIWGAFTVHSWFVPNPPEPEITYAEFPFLLEYEVDGVYHKYEDILVCEYKGASMNMGSGKKERDWTAYYKSKNEQITLFKNDEVEIFLFPNKPNSTESIRTAAILMGDNELHSGRITVFPDALYKFYKDEYQKDYLITAEELLSQYNIRLISWHCAPPIKNTFK